MRQSDGFVYFIFLLYAGSISLAFSVVHSFVILGSGEVLLLGVGLFSGPLFFAFHLFKQSERLVIAAVHIFLGILFHPAVTFKDPLYLSVSEQFELLRGIHETGTSWWARADQAHDLSRSLKASSTLQFKISSPLLYWAFPPSVALTFWGVLSFFYIPKLGKRDEENT